jgi:peptidoglycan hydrolase-like protein with peptidoglycan-binding domain
MNRAIVLGLCLAAAGGIFVYVQYSRGDTGGPVYTVPSRAPSAAPKQPAPPASRRIDPDDKAALTRELQRELRRVGCYGGEINGVWTTSSRLAMKTFVERANAALPIDNPDPVLLSLVQGYRDRACGVACPPGQTATRGGACLPDAVAAKAPPEAPPDAKGASPDAPVPPAGLQKERRPKHTASGPPKFVKDIMNALGF